MPRRATSGRLVCVVDDDVSLREAVEGLLKSVGYVVRSFGSAADLLSFDARREAICFILDIRMPGLDGFALQQQLAAEESAPPVIFLSSLDDEVSRARAIAGGALGFLGKPFDHDRLLSLINLAGRRGYTKV